ncbi:Fe-only nitrogenase accessory protein AnfO [Azomonas macrocytogenes]|uniref:Fe-only nitrogenase accessory protein AnfO n=1 Tax=Azomonas macrocytogenes TaxID=69962 RepID=A0A839T6P8_AZOMA|nr:Fe-only nitrogenase accessory protein AnfO [Azomonas macrocytogenes]MBB3103625.1 Fe-only nitrogenase accessory protein AnfO [Azomonas macrocytogenes]
MKIAAYVDEHKEMTTLYKCGSALLYEKSLECWKLKKEVPLEMSDDMNISEVKDALRGLVTQLEDCKILLSDEVRGLPYSILQEEMGFHTWRSNGAITEQLTNVEQMEINIQAEKELALAEEKAKAESESGRCKKGEGGRKQAFLNNHSNCEDKTIVLPECIEEGYYRIDLENVLKKDKTLNSRLVLIPFMEKNLFRKFEILCDHVPRWFSHKLDELNLIAEFDDSGNSGHALKVTVWPKLKLRKTVS